MYQKCPVCGGRGTVPGGFYSTYSHGLTTSLEPETCRRCNGLGTISDNETMFVATK